MSNRWQKQWNQWETLFWGPPKSLQMVTAAMKLKDTCSLEEMLWTTSVQFSRSVLSDSVIPWTAACQASLSITNSQSLLKPMSIESVMPSNHLILCHPLILLSSIFPSIRVFSSESFLHVRWPKDWSFFFNISPSNEHPGLISFRMDRFWSPCSPRESQESSPAPQF